jgi:hypothetical protein
LDRLLDLLRRELIRLIPVADEKHELCHRVSPL